MTHEDTFNQTTGIEAGMTDPLTQDMIDPINEPLEPTLQPLPAEPVGLENEGSHNMTESLRSFVMENPGPSLLIGAGLAWLFVSRERDKSKSLPTRLKSRAVSMKDTTRETVVHAKEATGEKIHSAKTAAQEALKTRYQTTLDENPLALGAVAMACGLAIGLLIPPSQKENELLGEASDSLMRQARQIANDARDAAISTLRAKKDDVREKLMAVREEAKSAVRESAEEAKQSFRSEAKAGDESEENSMDMSLSESMDTSTDDITMNQPVHGDDPDVRGRGHSVQE